MDVQVFDTKDEMGKAAAAMAAERLGKAIESKGKAQLIVATGASQFEMLSHLVKAPLDWSKVEAFHLDEYIGIDANHPASFRKYLRERFVEPIGNLAAFHYVNGEVADPEAECKRLNALIAEASVDVACIGIGENGHLAFNDPPADFETKSPFMVVELDEACRRQQVGEGWFESMETVPERALTMSIPQIMKSACIVCTVPDERKSDAVQAAVEGEVRPEKPASVLQRHGDCHLFLDTAAASRLTGRG